MSQQEQEFVIRYTDEQAMLGDTAVSFLRKKCKFEDVRRWKDTEAGYDRDLWNEMAELGWMGIAVPEEHGGVGLGAAEIVSVMEPMGEHLLATPFLATTLAGQVLARAGSDVQKEAWLPRIAAGEAVATLALTETDGSWEPEPVHVSAEQTGKGFRLSGTKTFVLDGRNADAVIVSARLDGEPALFLVEADGLDGRLSDELLVDETRRSSRLELDGLELDESARLTGGDAGEALRYVHSLAWLLLAAEMAGGANGVFDLTLEYVRTRTQFGKPIGSYQAIKHPMVDVMVGIENARSLVYYAATVFDGPGGESEIAARMAKAAATDAYHYAVDRAIQFHGAMGFTYECHAQLFFRRAQWDRHHFGDAAHHRRHLAELMLD